MRGGVVLSRGAAAAGVCGCAGLQPGGTGGARQLPGLPEAAVVLKRSGMLPCMIQAGGYVRILSNQPRVPLLPSVEEGVNTWDWARMPSATFDFEEEWEHIYSPCVYLDRQSVCHLLRAVFEFWRHEVCDVCPALEVVLPNTRSKPMELPSGVDGDVFPFEPHVAERYSTSQPTSVLRHRRGRHVLDVAKWT